MQDTDETLNLLKQQLTDINEKRTNGILMRSKAEWIEGSEKNSKYFSNLEKRNAVKKNISKLFKNDKEINKTADILKETKTFYENFYKKKNNVFNSDTFFEKLKLKQLTDIQRNSCEGKLIMHECAAALKEMKNNKSPGSDEFFKIFWNDLKVFYLDSINYSFEIGQLTQLQKHGIITLIPKKDKILTDLNNWRPITLLNIDYKIATKVIAGRIKNVLIHVINNCQTGFLKNRYIGENIRLLFDIIEFSNESDIPSCLIFADFEKAFDSLDHAFMKKTLTAFNFGDSFIKWISLFYNDGQSCIYNNGHIFQS